MALIPLEESLWREARELGFYDFGPGYPVSQAPQVGWDADHDSILAPGYEPRREWGSGFPEKLCRIQDGEPMPEPRSWYMRCAALCGQIVRSAKRETLEAECVKRGGFVKIGKLYYCPRCAKKQLRKVQKTDA